MITSTFYYYGHNLLFNQFNTFVINNDLGSTFEVRRWGGCSYDSLKFVTPAQGEKASQNVEEYTSIVYRPEG